MMMRKTTLNYGKQSFASGQLSRILMALAAACLLAALVALHSINQKIDLMETDMLAMQQPESSIRKLRPEKNDPLKQAEISAIKVAMSDLAMPWQGLFKTLERLHTPDIRLTAIEPNPRQHKLRLSASTSSTEAMFSYLKSLREQPAFSDAFLQTHEYKTDQGNMPVSFVIETSWTF